MPDTTTPHPKFVQIALGLEGDEGALYALDQDGNVWEYYWLDRKYGFGPDERIKSKGWHPLVMDRHQG